eukprot:1219151-Rhodomonas_salina.1
MGRGSPAAVQINHDFQIGSSRFWCFPSVSRTWKLPVQNLDGIRLLASTTGRDFVGCAGARLCSEAGAWKWASEPDLSKAGTFHTHLTRHDGRSTTHRRRPHPAALEVC